MKGTQSVSFPVQDNRPEIVGRFYQSQSINFFPETFHAMAIEFLQIGAASCSHSRLGTQPSTPRWS